MTTKPTVTTSGSTATPSKTGTPDITKIIETLSKSGGSAGTTGAVYTHADADADVQSVYQQILGRNAGGNDYAKAVAIAMGLGPDSGAAARQQAIMNFVQNTPEYAARQDNNYLDAIYKAIAADVANTQVVR
jgi:hypothetical protein